MNKQNIRNLYCSVCGNIVPCTKTKKRTVDAYCIYCGKKQKLIDRKLMEPKSQSEFELPRKNYNKNNNSYNNGHNNSRDNRSNVNKNYNHKNSFNNRGGKRYEEKDK